MNFRDFFVYRLQPGMYPNSPSEGFEHIAVIHKNSYNSAIFKIEIPKDLDQYTLNMKVHDMIEKILIFRGAK